MVLPIWAFVVLLIASGWGIFSLIVCIVLSLSPDFEERSIRKEIEKSLRGKKIISDGEYEMIRSLVGDLTVIKIPKNRDFKPNR